ncbi:PREDICTED: tetratricopeptide repeat protein 16-like, partial [Rhinopithecus bieti]|uniref:tetratricopeptide repeat protein 16-like n=1 Tax=Rhinopithecus bieti TaxID=61621 RepID=UPI00083C07C9
TQPGFRLTPQWGPEATLFPTDGRAHGSLESTVSCRQFQKAEDHFSTAIRHNPQKAQYYLYRAKSRQLLQNIFGARQDVATVLLLNPKQPKLSLLMTNLFPGMSVEEVLSTQIAHLARLQLERMVEGSLQAGGPQGIVGMLKQWELEHQKALALQRSWKQGEPLIETSEKLQATPEIPQVEPGSSEGEAEAPKEEEEKEKEKKEVSGAHARARSPWGLGQSVPQSRAGGCRPVESGFQAWLCTPSVV